ncbi:hypothetical protein ACH4OW_20815 [Streptomyces sp. NPDC017056]|uniref:hypothetical protein n=1 Tax=Streptomyces sp. NPDC017056 TaxID=3364973 RepID=UPI00378E8B83
MDGRPRTQSATGPAASWDAAAIRGRLAELARRDPRLARTGADKHRYRLAPPLPAAELRAFEAEHGVELPEPYLVRLVVTGAQRGRVWYDDLAVWPHLAPGPWFREWYAEWLADAPDRG